MKNSIWIWVFPWKTIFVKTPFWYFLTKIVHFLYEIFTCQIATSKTPTDRQIPIESTVINSNIFFLSLLFPSRYDFFFDSELCHFLHYVIFNVRFLDIKKSSFNSLGFVYLPFGVTLLSKKRGRPGIHLSSVPPPVVSVSRLNGRDHCLRFLSRPSRACLHPSFYNWLYTYTLRLVCSTVTMYHQHQKEHFRLKSVQLG